MLFDFYDLDKDGKIGIEDLKVFMRSVVANVNYYDESEAPTASEVEERAKQMMVKWDHMDKDGYL